jgi:hypothetical protein
MEDKEVLSMTQIVVLSPAGVVLGTEVSFAKRVPTLEGRVVGLINNSKTGSGPFLDLVEELLRSEYGVARTIRYDKWSAALPAPKAMLAKAASECDLVVNGIAD